MIVSAYYRCGFSIVYDTNISETVLLALDLTSFEPLVILVYSFNTREYRRRHAAHEYCMNPYLDRRATDRRCGARRTSDASVPNITQFALLICATPRHHTSLPLSRYCRSV
jgi:hypothetical protein